MKISLKELNNEKLYYVGGIVRDEILGKECFDVDVTYEGNAIEYCQNLDIDNLSIIQINNNFGTVKIKLGETIIDFASTRDEVYPQKGHLPVVKDIGCNLKQDVLRRDFTINALAKSVITGEIIDYVGGLKDINKKVLRILHDNSFIDDPTRIVRGLKFSVRFGFELEEHTKILQEKYLENVNYDMSYKRLKKELMETFNLNSQLAYNKFFEQKIYKLLSKNIPKFYDFDIENLIKTYPVNNTWLVYLGYMEIDNLPLTKIEKKIINDYKILANFNLKNNDFELYKNFKDKELESILLYIITTNKELGLRYLEIKDIKPTLTGKDLIGMGLEPSPKFEEGFDFILSEKLKNPTITKSDELELARTFFKI